MRHDTLTLEQILIAQLVPINFCVVGVFVGFAIRQLPEIYTLG